MSSIARGTTARKTGTTHLHLTQRGRVVFTALAAVPLVVGSLLIALNGGVAAATNDAADATFTYVTVAAGESLWQLAEEVAPSEDPRDVIADIVSLNQLASEDVQPGQRLALPISY
jgi:LysM repeat protein